MSDQPGVAAITDPNLVNAWGISHGPNTPVWVSDLWALFPGDRAAGGTHSLWFSAGPDGEAHGLLGLLRLAHR